MSVQVTYKKQVVFYMLIVLILIFTLEGSLRTYFFLSVDCVFEKADIHLELNYFEKKQICHEFHYVDSKHPKEGVYYYMPNQPGHTININNFGFRGPDISFEKPTDVFRIFMIGGSTTFGAPASSDSTTIAGYLQKYFNEEDMPKTIEVINAGRGSFFSLLETQLIKNKLLEFEPDLFLVYDGWNDIDHSIETHLGKKYQTSFIDDVIEDVGEIFPEYRTMKILRHIQYQLKMTLNTPENNVQSQFDTESIPQKVQLWEERWRDICILGQEKGFKTIITLQPLVGSGNKVLSDLEQIHYEKHIFQFMPYYVQYADAMERLEKDCTGTMDLRFAADSYNQTIFYDGGHVVDEGNELIAEKIYEKMLPIVLEDVQK